MRQSAAPSAMVSVVIPTRNRADLLPRALESVLMQSHAELEVIVVDDASTDATREVLRSLAESDSRVRIVSQARPAGACAARNRGLELARGEFVAFLDDDDEFLPDKLERQLGLLAASPASGVAYCPCLFVDAQGRESILGRPVEPGSERWELLRRNFVSTPAVLIRRELLRRTGGFDRDLPRLQDWDLWLRLAELTSFAYHPIPLARAHFTPVSISTSRDAMSTAINQLTKKLQRTLSDRRELAEAYHALGHLDLVAGTGRQGVQLLQASVRLRPFSLQRLLMLAAALASHGAYGTISAAHGRIIGWSEGLKLRRGVP